MPLLNEATGYDFKGKAPAGRCIVEDRNNAGKLSLWAQDLKPQTIYNIYLVFAQGGQFVGFSMGSLDVDGKGKAEFKKAISPGDVHNFTLQDIVAVAVVASGSMDIVSPLCGYRDTRVPWRHMFRVWEEPEMSRPEVINHHEHETEKDIPVEIPLTDSEPPQTEDNNLIPEPSSHPVPETETDTEPPDVEDSDHLPEPLNHPAPETEADTEPHIAEDIDLTPEPPLHSIDPTELEEPIEPTDIDSNQPIQQVSPPRATRPPAPVTEPDAANKEAETPPWWETSFPPTPPRATKPPVAKPPKTAKKSK